MSDARLIKKKISVDDKVSQLSMQSAFIFTWMLLFTDREGKLVCNPEILKGNCFPFVKELNAEKIEKSLIEIETAGLIVRYQKGNVQYCMFQSFIKNHSASALAREGASVIPNPEDCEIITKHPQDQLKTKSRVTRDIIEFDFESVYDRYPKKSAKAKCIAKMKASVKNDLDFSNLNKALTNYIALVEEDKAKGFEKRAWKDAPTFFNNWNDFIDAETETQRNERLKKEKNEKLEKEMEAKKAKFYAEHPEYKKEEGK